MVKCNECNTRFLYVRFGKIPKYEKSKNHLNEELENGISVYEAIERNNIIQIIFPFLNYGTCVSLSGCIDRKEIYEVVGNTNGIGSDGEPIMINCKIIRMLDEKILYGLYKSRKSDEK